MVILNNGPPTASNRSFFVIAGQEFQIDQRLAEPLFDVVTARPKKTAIAGA